MMNKLALLQCYFLLVILFFCSSHAMDICGDGTCGISEDTYWCGQDCGGVCGDTLCSRDESNTQCSECACRESIEDELARLINEYRVSLGLTSIPVGRKISIVARAHARDSSVSRPDLPATCNLHSWSSNTFDNLNFNACCYTGDTASNQCMWDKPREIAALMDNGFEISALGYTTAMSVLDAWKASIGHNPVIVNINGWEALTWNYIGVGYDPQRRFFHVWFYPSTDDEAKESDCGVGSPPVVAESMSPSLSASTSPSVTATASVSALQVSSVFQSTSPSPSTSAVPSVTAAPSTSTPPSATATPSGSISASASMVSTDVSSPGFNALECPGLFRVGTVERFRRSNMFIDRGLLWEGNLNAVNPNDPIDLPVLAQSWFRQFRTKVNLRFEVCGRQLVTVRYYEGNNATSKRRGRQFSDAATGLAYDNVERSIRKVFGRQNRYLRWSQSFVRVQVWLGNGDQSLPPSISFRLYVSQP